MWRAFFRAGFGAFICILLLCFTIYFTPHAVKKYLIEDGSLEQNTIYVINFIRFLFGILGTTGLFISYRYVTKPNIIKHFSSNQDQIWILKLMLFFFPIVFVICAILLKYFWVHAYLNLMIKEDSIIEWLQFLFYFMAFVVSFRISITLYRSNSTLFCLMYMILSIGLFFIAMEEISWGQRILQVSTPEFVRKYNYQNEMNIHNLKAFPEYTSYIIIGLYGAFSRFLIPKKIKIKYRSIVNLFVPNYYLFFYFFVVAIIFLYYGLSSIAVSLFGDWVGWGPGHFIIGKDQEPAEFLLSCGFLLFVTINKYRINWQKDPLIEKNEKMVRRTPSRTFSAVYNPFCKKVGKS